MQMPSKISPVRAFSAVNHFKWKAGRDVPSSAPMWVNDLWLKKTMLLLQILNLDNCLEPWKRKYSPNKYAMLSSNKRLCNAHDFPNYFAGIFRTTNLNRIWFKNTNWQSQQRRDVWLPIPPPTVRFSWSHWKHTYKQGLFSGAIERGMQF